MERYKVLKEYERFYLCEHPNGYKECFNKREYKPTDGYITKKEETDLGQFKQAPISSKKLEESYKKFFKLGG